jgi:Bacteriophage peptidoglycan hydrolase/Transglycosylase SLT domain
VASGIRVGNVIIGVLPDMTGFHEKIRAETVSPASSIGQDIGAAMSGGIGEKVAVGDRVAGSVEKDAAKITKAGESVGNKFTEALKGPFGAVSGMLGTALAVGGSVEIFKSLIESGERAEQATKIVEQAIEATGGAAHVSASQIEQMADAQSRKTGVDKASIEQADALILRFKGIQNEAGKGNDIFNRTTQAALDLTAGMHKGQVTADALAQTSKALGKALEDPAKGMSSLRRFGIVLDAEQQNEIKTDMKHHNTLAAQKVILDAVNASYGGAAAKMATNSAKMHASLQDLEEVLGQALLPAFNALVGLITKALNALMPLAEWFARGGTAATIVKDAIIALTIAVAAYTAYVKVAAIFSALWTTETEDQTIAQRLLNLTMLENPVGLVIAGIAALIFILIQVYNHSKAFRDIVHEAWMELKKFTDEIVADVKPALDAIATMFKTHSDQIKAIWHEMLIVLETLAKIFIADIEAFFKTFFDVIAAVFKVGLDILHGHWSAALSAIWALIQQVWNNISHFFSTSFDALNNLTGGKLTVLKNLFVGFWNWISQVFGTDMANFFTRTLPGWFSSAVSSVQSIWSKIEGYISAPVKWVAQNVLTHLFNAIDDITNFVGIGKPLQSAVNAFAGMAAGGIINKGTTSTADDVLIRVSRGETVVSAAHSALLAPAFRAVGVPGYGGGIGWPPHVRGKGNPGIDWIRGFAAGGSVSASTLETEMLNYMLSKQGMAYSEANRWGRPPFDCSSLVWSAANAAGIPIPQSQAIANTEADWFSGWDSDYMFQNMSQIQKGDILFMTGASPDPSRWGGIGHTGMAIDRGNMISALGTAYGVTTSPISGFVVGARLGGPGGKSVLSDIGHILSVAGHAIVRTVEQIFSGLGTMASIAVDIAKGNLGGAITALLGKWKGVGGAKGALASLLTHLPAKLVGDVIKKIVTSVKNFVTNQQNTGGGSGSGGSIAYSPGAGVKQWAGLISQALSMEHLPASYLGDVEYQMQTESGGNPNAVNNWDINAQMGTPSKGLMQVIQPTFNMWHWPGTSNNIFDPLANIAAALNYAAHGKGFGSGAGQIGSGHGYDLGGWLPPGASWAFNGTGRPEPVLTGRQWDAVIRGATGTDGAQYHAHFDGLTGQAIEAHVRSAFQAMEIRQGNLERQGRRR